MSFVNLVERRIGSIPSNDFGIVGSLALPFPHDRIPFSTLSTPRPWRIRRTSSMLHGCRIGFDLSDLIAHSFNIYAAVGVYDQPTRRWTSTHSPSSLGSSHTLFAQPTTTDPSGIRN